MASVKQDQTHHRTWAPLFLIGIVLIVIEVIGLQAERADRILRDTEFVNQQIPSAEALAHTYQSALRDAINLYTQTKQREIFIQSLLTMRAPSEYLAMHTQLVLTADHRDFSEELLVALIARMRQEYTWLSQ